MTTSLTPAQLMDLESEWRKGAGIVSSRKAVSYRRLLDSAFSVQCIRCDEQCANVIAKEARRFILGHRHGPLPGFPAMFDVLAVCRHCDWMAKGTALHECETDAALHLDAMHPFCSETFARGGLSLRCDQRHSAESHSHFDMALSARWKQCDVTDSLIVTFKRNIGEEEE